MSQGPFHSVASDAFGETFVLVVNGELSSLRKIRASHDIGLIFQLNGVRALRGWSQLSGTVMMGTAAAHD